MLATSTREACCTIIERARCRGIGARAVTWQGCSGWAVGGGGHLTRPWSRPRPFPCGAVARGPRQRKATHWTISTIWSKSGKACLSSFDQMSLPFTVTCAAQPDVGRGDDTPQRHLSGRQSGRRRRSGRRAVSPAGADGRKSREAAAPNLRQAERTRAVPSARREKQKSN